MASTMNVKYRAEIDGMRALAVLPVIFFHAGFESFSGGFVGVDVFFVISGYLITTIIVSELLEDRFSLVNFYERRARRILPALFFVMAACLPFAWLWLNPGDLKDFGQSLLAVSTFSSNFLFWRESGYFDTAAELKPLLHTWSLAVEEQYYILFPVFMLIAWRFGLKLVLWLCIAAFLASLLLAEWAAYQLPGAGFYLLPTRGWELLLGVLVSFYLLFGKPFSSRAINEVLSVLGFGLVVFSIVAFDESTPFPSLYALIPTIGTALLILAAAPRTFVHRLLANPVLVGIGLVSYSAYLWHQPVLAFARHFMVGQEIPEEVLLALCALSLALAWISWKYVEAPFRNRQTYSRKAVFRFSFLGLSGFALLGLVIHLTNGLETLKLASYSEEQLQTYEVIRQSTDYDMQDAMYSGECRFWSVNAAGLPLEQLEECFSEFGSPLLVLGDSHAMNLYNIAARSNQFPFVIGVSQGGCRPHTAKDTCHYVGMIEFLRDSAYLDPLVLYHQSGSYLIKDRHGNHEPALGDDVFFDAENVERVVAYLDQLSALGIDVSWLGPFVEYRIDPRRSYTRLEKVPDINFDVFASLEKDLLAAIKPAVSFRYVSFRDFYEITDEVVFDDCLIWYDGDHFSTCGEDVIAQAADWTTVSSAVSD